MTLSHQQYLMVYGSEVSRAVGNLDEHLIRLANRSESPAGHLRKIRQAGSKYDVWGDPHHWITSNWEDFSAVERVILRDLIEAFILLHSSAPISSTENQALRLFDSGTYYLAESLADHTDRLVELFMFLVAVENSPSHPAAYAFEEMMRDCYDSVQVRQFQDEHDGEALLLDEIHALSAQAPSSRAGGRASGPVRVGSFPVGFRFASWLLDFRSWIFCAAVVALRAQVGSTEAGREFEKFLQHFCNRREVQSLPEYAHVINAKASGLGFSKSTDAKSQAYAYARRAVSLAPTWPNSNHSAARLIFELSQTSRRHTVSLHDGLTYVDVAIENFPDYPKYYITRGTIQLHMDRLREASDNCDRAIYLIGRLFDEDDAEGDDGLEQAYSLRSAIDAREIELERLSRFLSQAELP
jgi:hypothetical protein